MVARELVERVHQQRVAVVRLALRDPGVPPGEIGIRASSDETKDGIVYTVSTGQGGREPTFYAFDTKTEKVTTLGTPMVCSVGYITALKIDPTGRYLYYIPGAHGFDALLVRIYENKELIFVAKVKDGFVPRIRDELLWFLRPLQTASDDKFGTANVSY